MEPRLYIEVANVLRTKQRWSVPKSCKMVRHFEDVGCQ